METRFDENPEKSMLDKLDPQNHSGNRGSGHHRGPKRIETRFLAREEIFRKGSVAQHGIADLGTKVVVETEGGEVLKTFAALSPNSTPSNMPAPPDVR